MKKLVKAGNKFMVRHGAKLLACMALLVAVVNAESACMFLSYQPEIPEELL